MKGTGSYISAIISGVAARCSPPLTNSSIFGAAFSDSRVGVPAMSPVCAGRKKRCGKNCCSSSLRPLLHWTLHAGMETTIRAYGGDLRQGFAACRDGARAITRWTSALRCAMNATPGHTALFASLRHAAFTQDHGLLFVHAAIEPSRPLSEQRDAFWWGREDILELREPFAGFRRIVRGVDRDQRGVVEREFAVTVDGGAGHGGRLMAACFGLDGALVDIVEA
jgi:serine/threonine protein phosphatase 1